MQYNELLSYLIRLLSINSTAISYKTGLYNSLALTTKSLQHRVICSDSLKPTHVILCLKYSELAKT